MTALAAAANRLSKEDNIFGYPVLTNTVIYKGAIVVVDDNGFAIPATDTANLRVVGVADDTVNNNPGASGAKWVRVTSGRAFLFAATSITQAMVGDPMFVVDDNTVDDAAGSTNEVPVGRLVEFVSTTSGYVYIPNGPRMKARVPDATYSANEQAVLEDVV